jgi:hypothetical protein
LRKGRIQYPESTGAGKGGKRQKENNFSRNWLTQFGTIT